MDSRTVDKIKHVINTDVIRRALIQSFVNKGFKESFDRPLYPSIIQDLPMIIPSLTSKIEIIPHALNIDPALGKAVIGWNLFALGNHRMYLGETYHSNLTDLAKQIKSGNIRPISEGGTARRQTTPKRVVSFITRVLSDHEAGYVDLNPTTRPIQSYEQMYRSRASSMSMPQQFYGRPV